jgi:hypothetical protein
MKNNFIASLLFELYLKLKKYGYSETSEHCVYDHLGIIDTLGYTKDNTKFTYSYSDEFVFVYGIKLPFNYVIEVVSCSCNDNTICLKNFTPYLIK